MTKSNRTLTLKFTPRKNILTCGLRHAFTRKGSKALRVRDGGSPADGVRPPRRGRGKSRHWCRSAWLNAALACPRNDYAIKEAVAVGIGLHLRPGEQHEPRVRDLDLDAGEARIHRGYKEQSKRVGETKTDEGVRTVTIPTWLRPLLDRIAEEREPADHVTPWLAAAPEDDRAEAFRTFLRNGGKAPTEIFEDTATHEMIDFRSVRDTGITLRFLAGERAEVVQREAGHEHITTTLGYAKEVSNKGARYGVAFLTLPDELVGDAKAVALGGAASALCAASHAPYEVGGKCEVPSATSLGVFGCAGSQPYLLAGRPSTAADLGAALAQPLSPAALWYLWHVQRTYALFDVIGIKKAIESGQGAALLGKFWGATENWVNHRAKDVGRVALDDGSDVSPAPRVVTYSDSAILWHDPELRIDAFYSLVRAMKKAIDDVCRSYVIVARDEEIAHEPPAITVFAAGDDRPLYQNVLGSGAVVQNLFVADNYVRTNKEWHDRGASLYCVGAKSKPDADKVQGEATCKGLSEPILVLD